jgi:hypothetical protein
VVRVGQVSFSMATRVTPELDARYLGECGGIIFFVFVGKEQILGSKGLLCIIVMARSYTTHIKMIVMARAMCTGLVFA